MPGQSIKEKLINKIKETTDNSILEEVTDIFDPNTLLTISKTNRNLSETC